MNPKKTLPALILCAALVIGGFTGCTHTADSTDSSGAGANGKNAPRFTIGICQLAQHPSLDAAAKGFQDAVEDALPGQVRFDVQNASNDIPTCAVICNGFAASGVDLILANATPALQAAASATIDIPILGTAVTEYGAALNLDAFDGTVGGNISGTSDLAPLDEQAALIPQLVPQAETVGILYCSAESNSVYQADAVKAELEKAGLRVSVYTFSDSNDVAAVTAGACVESDVLYIPTDNTAASCAAAIHNAASSFGTPIITGDAGTCRGCGIASLCIDYYELGRTTGEMAVRILTGQQDISQMPIEYSTQLHKQYNPELARALNIEIPQDFVPLT